MGSYGVELYGAVFISGGLNFDTDPETSVDCEGFSAQIVRFLLFLATCAESVPHFLRVEKLRAVSQVNFRDNRIFHTEVELDVS